MKFNSKSVLLNRGVNYRIPLETPPALKNYTFTEEVVKEAIDEFNKHLNKRPRVTMHLGDIKVDVLRLVPAAKSFALWLVVKEKDIDDLHKICFTIKGEVIFAENSDVQVDKMVIKDVMYDDDKGLFTKKDDEIPDTNRNQ